MKALFRQYLWLIVLIAVALVGIGTFFIAGVYQEKKFDQTVTNQRTEANKSLQESRTESGVAANYSIERRTEDAIREKTIAPKLGEARRRSDNSKTNLETAKKNYELKKFDTENLTSDDSLNCRNLAELFPNVEFESCQPN